MLSPASPPGPALGPALREGLKLGPGPSPTFKARARPELVFLGPDPSLEYTKLKFLISSIIKRILD